MVNQRTLGNLTLPGTASSVPIARVWLSGTLVGAGHGRLDDVLLVLSELATNAVRHSSSKLPGGRVMVRVSEVEVGLVRVEVIDEGSDDVPCRREPDFDRCTGRGLHLVEMLSKEWGHHRIGPICGCVWAEVPTRPGCLVSRPGAYQDS